MSNEGQFRIGGRQLDNCKDKMEVGWQAEKFYVFGWSNGFAHGVARSYRVSSLCSFLQVIFPGHIRVTPTGSSLCRSSLNQHLKWNLLFKPWNLKINENLWKMKTWGLKHLRKEVNWYNHGIIIHLQSPCTDRHFDRLKFRGNTPPPRARSRRRRLSSRARWTFWSFRLLTFWWFQHWKICQIAHEICNLPQFEVKTQ